MFNVWPFEIKYTRTASEGVLAGIPCVCTLGVESEAAGREHFAELIKNNPDVFFNMFSITAKK